MQGKRSHGLQRGTAFAYNKAMDINETPITLTEYLRTDNCAPAPIKNPIIKTRSKLYTENANKVGWHVHVCGEGIKPEDQYIGYIHQELDCINSWYRSTIYRLTAIYGNVLVFES